MDICHGHMVPSIYSQETSKTFVIRAYIKIPDLDENKFLKCDAKCCETEAKFIKRHGILLHSCSEF